MIGTAFAYFAYRQYYPSLDAQFSQNPYPPRIRQAQDIFPDQNRPGDVEAAVSTGDRAYDECLYRNFVESSSRLN